MGEDGKIAPVPVHGSKDIKNGNIAINRKKDWSKTEMNPRYPAMLEPQEPSGYCVQFVDIEEASTEGETLEEYLFNAAEVLTAIIEIYIEDGREIPRPSENVEGAYYVAPDARAQSQLY